MSLRNALPIGGLVWLVRCKSRWAILSAIRFVVLSHSALVSNAHYLDSCPKAAAMQQSHELRRSLPPPGVQIAHQALVASAGYAKIVSSNERLPS